MKKEIKKWIIYAVDNEYDDCAYRIGAFEGTEDEVRDYAYSLLLTELREEDDVEDIEYISRCNNDFTPTEMWCIQRNNSHKTCFVEEYDEPVFRTIKDMDRSGINFINNYPNGLSQNEIGSLSAI